MKKKHLAVLLSVALAASTTVSGLAAVDGNVESGTESGTETGGEVETGNGDEGETGDGDEGETGDGDEGETGDGDEGETGDGDEGETGDGDEGETGDGDEGETGDGDEGETGDGSEGGTGSGDADGEGDKGDPEDSELDSEDEEIEEEETELLDGLQPEEDETVLTILSFEPLEKDVYRFAEKPEISELLDQFPSYLTAVVLDETEEEEEEDEGEAAKTKARIPVDWECDDDYEETEQEEYIFTAVPDLEGYESAAEELPEIQVVIEEEEGLVLTAEVDGTTITITADAGVLPADTVLKARKITKEQELETAKEAINSLRQEENETSVQEVELFDITLWDGDGNEIQPDTSKGELQVTFENARLEETDGQEELKIYHFEDDVESAVEEVETTVDGGALSCAAEHFSVFARVSAAAGAAVAEVDGQSYDSLQDAVDAAKDGKTVTLINDVELTKRIAIVNGYNLTIDLNGKKITTGEDYEIANAGIITLAYGANLTLEDSVGDGEVSYTAGKNEFAAIAVLGNESKDMPTTLILNGGIYEGYYYGVCGNGTSHNTEITINGGTVRGSNGSGIYHPQEGTLLITDGTIWGQDTGIELRSGTLEMSGGEVSSTATPTSVAPNGSGTTTAGAGIAVAQHTTKKNINVMISGGKVSGFTAFNEVDPQNNNLPDTITLSITGGEFSTASGGETVVSSVLKTGFVSGGTFSANVESEYVADGYVCLSTDGGENFEIVDASRADAKSIIANNGIAVAEAEGIYYGSLTAAAAKGGNVTLLTDTTEDVKIPAGANVTLDLNGKILTNKENDTIYITKGAVLTIIGDGTVDNVTHAKAAIFNNGATNLKSGTFTRSQENGIDSEKNGGNSYYNILNHGTMTIEDGVSVFQDGHFSSLVANGYYNYGASSERSGYVSGTNEANPTLTIYGGIFSGGINTIKNDDGATIEILGGTVTNMTQAALQNHNVATIRGGNFKLSGQTGGSATYAVVNCGCFPELDLGILTISGGTFEGGTYGVWEDSTESSAQLTISGGTFKGTAAAVATRDNTKSTITITGGAFSHDPDADYLAAGYQTGLNEDGLYEVYAADDVFFELLVDGEEADGDVPLQMDANAEAQSGHSVVLSVSDPFYGPYDWEISDATVAGFSNGTENSVILTALKAGKATVTVTSAAGEAVSIDIVVIDSSMEADSDTAASTVSVDVSASDVETPAVEGNISEEKQAQLESDKNALISDLGEDLGNNASVANRPVEVEGDVVSVMAEEGILNDGQKIIISTDQTLTGVSMNVKVTYEEDENGNTVLDEDGAPVVKTAEPYIEQMTYEINARYELQDLDGNSLGQEEIFNPDGKFSITFRIPIPSSVRNRFANVEHRGSGRPVERFQESIRGAANARYIEITTDHFSEFVLTFTDTKEVTGNTNTGTSSGRSGGGNSSGWHPQGSWQEDSVGWKFKTYEGPYAVNCWKYLPWNGQNEWYHFDANGYMQTGWFTDVDGHVYYLYPIPDGSRGRMLTGWQAIDGKMYYFNTVSDGTRGALYVNRQTPDGYLVGADGALIQ